MSPTTKKNVSLQVRAADQGTEIWVLDGRFQTVAHGLGSLNKSLAPGIYQVRAMAGNQTWEELVALEPGKSSKHVDIPLLQFKSAAPLFQTSQTHEYHIAAANEQSKVQVLDEKKGSAIFILARRFTPDEERYKRPYEFKHPARGLKLLSPTGKLVADLFKKASTNQDEIEYISANEPEWLIPDAWATFNIQVKPGVYRLRLEMEGLPALEQALVAVPDWQLQVFLLSRDYTPPGSMAIQLPADMIPKVEGADLLEATINYAKLDYQRDFSDGIYQEGSRLMELARQGLANQRQVLGREQTEILWKKYENPMLGILGGHLLLLDPEPNLNLLNTVVTNLRSILGKNHPDVEALALALGPTKSRHIFRAPPMLRRSWELVLKASVHKPKIVPRGSWSSQIAKNLWSTGTWLVWSSPLKETLLPKALSSVDYPFQQSWESILVSDQASDLSEILSSISVATGGSPVLDDYEQAMEMYLNWMEPPDADQQNIQIQYTTDDADNPVLDDESIRKLVRMMGLPRAEVEQALEGLWSKARRYEIIRKTTPFGDERTMQLESEVNQLRKIASQYSSSIPVLLDGLVQSDQPGDRVAALAVLQEAKDPEYIDFIINAIEDPNAPFDQYQALLAAFLMMDELTDFQKQALKEAIQTQRKRGGMIRKGTDRWGLSKEILENI